MFEQLKPLLASRTIWANLVGFTAVALTAFGFGSDALGDQGKLADALLQVVAGLSFIASTVFRVAATRKLR